MEGVVLCSSPRLPRALYHLPRPFAHTHAGFGVADTPSGREELAKGRVFLVAAGADLRLEGMGATPLHVAIAHANVHMPK